MAKVSGLALVATRNYVGEKHGQGAVDRVLAALEPADRELFRGVILARQFYPVVAYAHWLEKERELLYGGNEDEVLRRAVVVIKRLVPSLHRVLLRVGSPDSVVARLATINPQYFEAVEVKAIPLEKGKVQLVYSGFERQDRPFETVLAAWWLVMLELMGTKDYRFDIQVSIGEGKPDAEYLLSWGK